MKILLAMGVSLQTPRTTAITVVCFKFGCVLFTAKVGPHMLRALPLMSLGLQKQSIWTQTAPNHITDHIQDGIYIYLNVVSFIIESIRKMFNLLLKIA